MDNLHNIISYKIFNAVVQLICSYTRGWTAVGRYSQEKATVIRYLTPNLPAKHGRHIIPNCILDIREASSNRHLTTADDEDKIEILNNANLTSVSLMGGGRVDSVLYV